MDHGFKDDGFPVGSELGLGAGEGEIGHPSGFPRAGHIHHVDLTHFVLLTLGHEGKFVAFCAPGRIAFRAGRGREPSGRSCSVGGDDPEVAYLLGLVVGWFGHGNNGPATVRTDDGGADSAKEPDIFVSNRSAPARNGEA